MAKETSQRVNNPKLQKPVVVNEKKVNRMGFFRMIFSVILIKNTPHKVRNKILTPPITQVFIDMLLERSISMKLLKLSRETKRIQFHTEYPMILVRGKSTKWVKNRKIVIPM